MSEIDGILLNFSPEGMTILNIVLSFVMFSVALDINFRQFKEITENRKSLYLGVFAQIIALPAATFLLILLLKPQASIALGMILVAACPGGNISNFITHRADGNTALSILMTAISTLACVITTPVNIAFWGGLYAPSRDILHEVSISFSSMIFTVFVLLGAPLALGLLTAHLLPSFTQKYRRWFQNISMVIFVSFIILALAANWTFFLKYAGLVFLYVLAHNSLALLIGDLIGRMGRVSVMDRRAITIETGIQNSGLGLILIFHFFDGLGGMALIAALWGIWHAISGIALAYFMSRHSPSS